MSAHTDPNIDRTYLLSPTDAAADPSELRMNLEVFGDRVPVRAISNYLADPQFAGQPGTELAFDCQGNFESGIAVSLTSHNWIPQAIIYRVKLTPEELPKKSGTVRLALERFQSDKGESPLSWQTIDTLQIEGDAAKEPAPVLGRFRWEKAAGQ